MKERPPRAPFDLQLVKAPDSVWRGIEARLDAGGQVARSVPWWRWAAAAMAVASLGVWWATRGGDWLDSGTVALGSIGRMEVATDTRVRVLRQSAGEIRVELAYGEINVDVTAPPRLFFVETPSATAVDLGCAYKLRTDEAGNGLLQVTGGWVALEREGRESLVPAGASCRTRAGGGPGTPFFIDASEALRAAIDAFDRDGSGLDVILREARERDTLSLWHLVPLVEGAERERLVDRIAELVPLPEAISRERVLALDPDTLRRWREELAWSW